MALSKSQQQHLDRTHATVLRALLDGADLEQINGHTAKSLIRRGFLTNRCPNDAAAAWLAGYTGPVDDPAQVLKAQAAQANMRYRKYARKAEARPVPAATVVPALVDVVAARARLVVEEILDNPKQWLFFNREASDAPDLSADALGILVYLGVIKKREPVETTVAALVQRFPDMGEEAIRNVLAGLVRGGYVSEVYGAI